MLLKKVLAGIFIWSICFIVHAEIFVIKQIKVIGLKRVKLETVLNTIQIRTGQKIDIVKKDSIIHLLYKKGFFSNISLYNNKEHLIIDVTEFPTISNLKIICNDQIDKKQIQEILKKNDVIEGSFLNYAKLNISKNEIIDLLNSIGLYNVKIDINEQHRAHNCTSIVIKIIGGEVSKINSIHIIGNNYFNEKNLLNIINPSSNKIFKFFLNNNNEYLHEKFKNDLEKIKLYYMDNGFLNMKITNYQIKFDKNKKNVDIKIYINEGFLYKNGKILLEGNNFDIVNKLYKIITIKEGDIFSRKKIIENQNNLISFLNNNGYGFIDIIVNNQIDHINKKININYKFNINDKIYLRYINFFGNYKTDNTILRREMRIYEGEQFSPIKITESHRRLSKLNYLEIINNKIVPINGTNKVDLIYNIKEKSAIQIKLQGGFSNKDGFVYGIGAEEPNIFGSGKSIIISLDNVKSSYLYSIAYYNPYFTKSGIGLSYNFFTRRNTISHKLNEINKYIIFNKVKKISKSKILDNYLDNSYGTGLFIEFPLSNYSKFRFGNAIETYFAMQGINPNKKMDNFFNTHGTKFNQFKIMTKWLYDSLDKNINPTTGLKQTLGVDVYIPFPGSNGLYFYLSEYNATIYSPLMMDFILRGDIKFGYGNSFKKNEDFFFLKNFFTGGLGSIRGFEADKINNERIIMRKNHNQSIGGNIITLASCSLIIPNYSMYNFRPSLFIDVGCVYDKEIKLEYLRSSCGFQLEWQTSIAPLIFSFGIPINKQSWDHAQMFQWSIGAANIL